MDSVWSFDLFMRSRPIAMGTELLNLQPFSSVPTILLGGVSRNSRGAFGGIGPAFGALESDHDPGALAFCHKGRDAAIA